MQSMKPTTGGRNDSSPQTNSSKDDSRFYGPTIWEEYKAIFIIAGFLIVVILLLLIFGDNLANAALENV